MCYLAMYWETSFLQFIMLLFSCLLPLQLPKLRKGEDLDYFCFIKIFIQDVHFLYIYNNKEKYLN